MSVDNTQFTTVNIRAVAQGKERIWVKRLLIREGIYDPEVEVTFLSSDVRTFSMFVENNVQITTVNVRGVALTKKQILLERHVPVVQET